MTALTADREPPYKQGVDLPLQLAASTTIYAGSLVMLDGGFSTRASQRGIWQGDCGSSPRASEKQQHDSRRGSPSPSPSPNLSPHPNSNHHSSPALFDLRTRPQPPGFGLCLARIMTN